MNIKRIKAAVIAAATALTALASIPVMNVSATQMTFLQGDVNGDGSSNLTDCILHSKYSIGNYQPSTSEITRMDVNQDKVIDVSDGNYMLDYALSSATPQNITVEQFANTLNNDSRYYLKYDCSSMNNNNDTDCTTYYLPNTISSTREIPGINNEDDTENLNTVRLVINGENAGSGFIVDEHIVATAAHCVAFTNPFSNQVHFAGLIDVQICDTDGETEIAIVDSSEIHVPQKYAQAISGEINEESSLYDYALIYVEEDLTQYDNRIEPWNIGYMTDEFMSTNSTVVSSGFTEIQNDERDYRYYSAGAIVNDATNNLRYHTQGQGGNGKSGGPAYYESTYNGTTIKNVVGVHTASSWDNETQTVVHSFGVRITPTITRFWLNNANIGTN